MKSEKIAQTILGGLMLITIIAIAWFFIQSDKQAAVEQALAKGGQTNQRATAKGTATKTAKNEKFSIDNAEDPFKTLSLNEVDEILTSGRKQMLFIGCRYCPHCQSFEPTIKKFITKHNFDRNAIQKWEAGYQCYVKEGEDGHEQYMRLADKLIDGGVPQVLYIENGKIVDTFADNRTVEGLENFFKKHNYLLQ
ncbi:MAG: hypothetical protein Q3996_01970 [Candidatus Saccharibacteria bacterium]|nr:hypothetical protein [Candidatus Saccharibacteria bacterium]